MSDASTWEPITAEDRKHYRATLRALSKEQTETAAIAYLALEDVERYERLFSRLRAFIATLPDTPPERPEHGHMGDTAWLVYAREEMAYDIRQELVAKFPEVAEGE